MTTASAPEVKKYKPENLFFYRDLRERCLKAVEGPPALTPEEATRNTEFLRAYERIETIRYFGKSGFLAPAMAESLYHDVQALVVELRSIASDRRSGTDFRFAIILSNLQALHLENDRVSTR
ncbi:hypothetical protein KW790_01280 [Candidatus Parcubacteria bacterium]|nr:hypothetical protein [Candidatus Parcubacteria bacterium]